MKVGQADLCNSSYREMKNLHFVILFLSAVDTNQQSPRAHLLKATRTFAAARPAYETFAYPTAHGMLCETSCYVLGYKTFALGREAAAVPDHVLPGGAHEEAIESRDRQASVIGSKAAARKAMIDFGYNYSAA